MFNLSDKTQTPKIQSCKMFFLNFSRPLTSKTKTTLDFFNNQIDPTFVLCQEHGETPWHLLTECHATLNLRLKKLPPEPWEVTPRLKCSN
jgi:hypothetical protein